MPGAKSQHTFDDDTVDVAAPLDLLLTQAATGVWRRLLPSSASIGVTRQILANPRGLRRSVSRMMGEQARIVTGRSHTAPDPKDRRFAEPAWSNNPVLKLILQTYLVQTQLVRELVDGVELSERDRERVRFALDNTIDALSPANNPVLNPLFWKALIDSGGRSAVRGARNLATDLASSPRVPSMVDTSTFRVGRTVAATPGTVVLRTPQVELIRYSPTTAQVGATPLLIVPPVINKYYVVDLAPGRSLVEYLVSQGHTVFAISWRNPDTRHRDWGFDTYLEAIDNAATVVAELTGSARTHLLSLCSGGALSGMWAARAAARGDGERIATFSLAVSVLDQTGAGTVSALADPAAAAAAVRASSAKGYLDGTGLAEVFAWLRPNDLIWNYWVNNYLQGRRPPAFDILYWNADVTRMAARLHAEFVDLFLHNKLTRPGSVTVSDTPIDLSAITADSYIVGGISDHICPWQACYRSTSLLGGKSRFVLSRSGHVACIVNPPGNAKATFRSGSGEYPNAAQWLENAESHTGSWWEDYSTWLSDRGDGLVDAPTQPGSDDHPALDTAPGSYVFDS